MPSNWRSPPKRDSASLNCRLCIAIKTKHILFAAQQIRVICARKFLPFSVCVCFVFYEHPSRVSKRKLHGDTSNKEDGERRKARGKAGTTRSECVFFKWTFEKCLAIREGHWRKKNHCSDATDASRSSCVELERQNWCTLHALHVTLSLWVFFSYWALKIASVFDRGPEIGRGYHLYKKDRDSEKTWTCCWGAIWIKGSICFSSCFCVTWSRLTDFILMHVLLFLLSARGCRTGKYTPCVLCILFYSCFCMHVVVCHSRHWNVADATVQLAVGAQYVHFQNRCIFLPSSKNNINHSLLRAGIWRMVNNSTEKQIQTPLSDGAVELLIISFRYSFKCQWKPITPQEWGGIAQTCKEDEENRLRNI